MTVKHDNTLDAIGNAETIGLICGAVAIGGTLVAYCNEQALDYKLINRWINDDEERAKRYKLSLDIRDQHARDLIVSELICYLRAKPVDAFERDEASGRQALKDIQDMPAELQRLIASVEFEEIFEWQGEGKEREKVHVGRMHKIKFWDKPRTVETFMKHLSMLIERKDIHLKASLADLVVGSMKPEEKPANGV